MIEKEQKKNIRTTFLAANELLKNENFFQFLDVKVKELGKKSLASENLNTQSREEILNTLSEEIKNFIQNILVNSPYLKENNPNDIQLGLLFSIILRKALIQDINLPNIKSSLHLFVRELMDAEFNGKIWTMFLDLKSSAPEDEKIKAIFSPNKSFSDFHFDRAFKTPEELILWTDINLAIGYVYFQDQKLPNPEENPVIDQINSRKAFDVFNTAPNIPQMAITRFIQSNSNKLAKIYIEEGIDLLFEGNKNHKILKNDIYSALTIDPKNEKDKNNILNKWNSNYEQLTKLINGKEKSEIINVKKILNDLINCMNFILNKIVSLIKVSKKKICKMFLKNKESESPKI